MTHDRFAITAVDPAEVTVRNLALDDFSFSPQTGKFDLNVTWQKPSFNYSRILSYSLAYQVNEGSKNFINTVSFFTLETDNPSKTDYLSNTDNPP